MITNVSSTEALYAALKVAHGGDVIRLASGNYDYVKLYGANFSSEVTITSADPGKPAVINGINIDNSSNLTFKNLDVTFSEKFNGAMYVGSSSNIRIDGVELAGSKDLIGTGLFIRNSSGVTANNVDVHDFSSGIAHLNSDHIQILGSRISGMSNDGVRGGGSSNVTIDGNTFTDFHLVGASHNDAIQFWTSGTTTAAHDLTITNNTILRGNGDPVQGVFMNNENYIAYENVTITGNAIIGGAYHGITVIKGTNVRVDGNLVEGYKDMQSWISVKESTGVSLQHNAATSWIVSDNTGLTEGANQTLKLGSLGDVGVWNYWTAHEHQVSADAVAGPAPTSGPAAPIPPDPSKLITGTGASETLSGGSGNDTLDGGGGSDILTGGAGDDVYVINVWGAASNELAGGGHDTVRTAQALYELRANVEDLTLTGTAFQRGYGNASDNIITGNAVSNSMEARDGNDTLVSNGGADTMSGGAGKDVFDFNKMPTKGVDVITDFTRGTDLLDLRDLLTAYKGTNPIADGWVKFTTDTTGTTVYVDPNGPTGPGGFVALAKLTSVTTALTASDISYAVVLPSSPAPVAPVVTLGNVVLGTSAAETLAGTAGNDTLDGGGGSDILTGGAGDDVYVINVWGAASNELAGGGHDTVRTAQALYELRANVEDLTLTGTAFQRGYGNASDNIITGNAVSNTMEARDGNDTLVSNGGVDTMTGGAGRDVFDFNKMPIKGVSTITDFTKGSDVLDLHDLLTAYKGTNPQADGWVKFTTDTTGTTVYVDADGPTVAGGFVAVAKLTGVVALGSSDWIF